MENLYDYPRYYEIAFSWRDSPHEARVFDDCIRRFSKIPVQCVLELASGPSPHLEELTRRGMHYTGIDINPNMLAYAQQKADSAAADADFICADIRSFSLNRKVDFAFILLGSLIAVNEDELMSHFHSVAAALRRGGLYLLDYCVNFEPDLPSEVREWSADVDGVHIDVAYVPDPSPNRATQVGHNLLKARVTDNGREFRLESDHVTRAIYPQEFLLLIEKTRQFEFVGWWNQWDLDQPIEKARRTDNPITIIRRT